MKIYSYVTFFILLFPFTVNAQSSIGLQRDPSDPNTVFYVDPDTGQKHVIDEQVNVIERDPVGTNGDVALPKSEITEDLPENQRRNFARENLKPLPNRVDDESSFTETRERSPSGEGRGYRGAPYEQDQSSQDGSSTSLRTQQLENLCRDGVDRACSKLGKKESDPGLAESAGQCESDASTANGRCSVFDNIMMAGMLAPIMSGVGSGGSGKKACETAQALNAAGLVTNITFARRCRSAAQQCIDSCRRAISYIERNPKSPERSRLYSLRVSKGDCEGLKSKTAWVWMSAAQNVQAILASRDCVEHFKNAEKIERCRTLSEEEFKGDTFCQREYCNRLPFNIRLHDPLCKDGVEDIDCSIKHNFGKLACVCERNPQDPACGMPNANPNQPVAPPNPYDPVDPYGDGDMPFQPEDFLDPLEDPQAAPGGTSFGGPSAPGGNGGGYGGLGGGSNSGGSYSAGSTGRGKGNSRRGKSGSNKSIISGSSSGRSSGGGRYGGGYPPNFRNREYTGKRSAPFDLKKLLPGTKTRGLAGASKKKMEKAGISSANGLTNWEKVRIRYMEQRRRNSFINKP